MAQQKKIFISYSHDSDSHKEKVLKLATLLYSHGAKVYFDQFDLQYGDDLALFMEQGLTQSDYILVICSDLYTQKANKGVGGAGYEKSIMTASLMKYIHTGNLIPIKMNNYKGKMPTFISAKFYADFDKGDFEQNYRTLYQQIWHKTLKEQIDIDREYIKGIGRNVEIISATQKNQYHSFEMAGKVTFHFTSNSGHYIIGAGEFEFTTAWSGCGTNSIYAYKDYVSSIGYKPHIMDYPNLSELLELDYSSRCWSINVGEIFVLKNSNNYFAIIKVISVDNVNELVVFEYKILDSLK